MTSRMPTPESLEAIEAAAWRDLVASAPASARRALGLDVVDVDGAVCLVATGADTIMFNRAIGAAPASFSAVAACYAARGVARYFVHAPRSTAAASAARAAGLDRYRRAWVKLARDATTPAPVARGPEVSPATAADADAIGRLFCHVFDVPLPCAPMIGGVIGRPGWEVYACRDHDGVFAFGMLFTAGELAYLAGAGTAPSHRRRGAQGALMAHRIERARQLGCLWLASETGEAAPGDPQHSYRNMEKCGFRPVGVRDNYAPTGVIWDHGAALA